MQAPAVADADTTNLEKATTPSSLKKGSPSTQNPGGSPRDASPDKARQRRRRSPAALVASSVEADSSSGGSSGSEIPEGYEGEEDEVKSPDLGGNRGVKSPLQRGTAQTKVHMRLSL